MILNVLFWILWILCIVGAFTPDTAPYIRGRWVVLLLLIGILGLKVFDSPLK